MDPELTSYSRGNNEANVLLPAPEGPTSAVMVPGKRVNEMS